MTGGDGGERYERAVRLVTLVGRAPAGPDVVTEQADTVVEETGVDADLRARFVLVADTAAALHQALLLELGGTAADGGLGTADAAILGRLVVAARAWGVAPDPPPETVPDGAGPVEAAERRLVATAVRAAALLAPRIAALPEHGHGPPRRPRRGDGRAR